MSDLYKLISLAPPDRRTLLAAGLVLPIVSLALGSFGLRRTRSICSRFVSRISQNSSMNGKDQIVNAIRLSRMVDLAARRGIFKANCLHRSLVLWWMLEMRGIKSELRFGARKIDGRFEAHAWVEIDGRIINDAPDIREQYAPFERPYSLETLNF